MSVVSAITAAIGSALFSTYTSANLPTSYAPITSASSNAEQARLLLLSSSELMHEMNSISSKLDPLYDLFEYEHGS
jgi:hypothetical protein